MNEKFDELAKGLARSVTRRGALKKFGTGLAGIALASLGLASKAEAGQQRCVTSAECAGGYLCWSGHCIEPTLNKCNKCVYPFRCSSGDAACLNACLPFCLRGG